MTNIDYVGNKFCGNNGACRAAQLSKGLDCFLSRISQASRSTSMVDKILNECHWTDTVEELFELGNEYVLSSFTLSLVLEEK